jgi:hypothetical protein
VVRHGLDRPVPGVEGTRPADVDTRERTGRIHLDVGGDREQRRQHDGSEHRDL